MVAETLTGTVESIIKRYDMRTYGMLHTSNGKIKFAAQALLEQGQTVTMSGNREQDTRYGGIIFRAHTAVQTVPKDTSALVDYLADDPKFPGIGQAYAKKLVKAFGADFDRVIRETPERIHDVIIITDDNLSVVQNEWILRTDQNDTMMWLTQMGLTPRQCQSVWAYFGLTTRQVLTDDPYQLMSLQGFGFIRADDFAMQMGIAPDCPQRVIAKFLDVLQDEESAGNCWTWAHELVVKTQQGLNIVCDDKLFSDCVNLAAATRRVFMTSDSLGRHVVATTFTAMCARTVMDVLEQAVDTTLPELAIDLQETLTKVSPTLNEEQRKAALAAFAHSLSIIVGAAGSGKSYTIASIQQTFLASGLSVALAAPTGKAAKRMEHFCHTPASTIHRLLGFNTVEWMYNQDNKLPYDVIIIDEVSMLGIHLFYRLISAIDFTRTRLVLVGDPNQLPPIEPGNPIRDMLAWGKVPVTLLTSVMRQAGDLKKFCADILHSDLHPTLVTGVPNTLSPWYVWDVFQDNDSIIKAMLQILFEHLPARGLDTLTDVQVLTMTNKGPLGTIALNRQLQEMIQRTFYYRTPELDSKGNPRFCAGDKIMQTRNNYKLDLMNGSIGFIREITTMTDESGITSNVYVCDFEGVEKIIPQNSPDAYSLSLAYAVTVHKAQGSEFPVSLILVSKEYQNMLTRSWLYTAVTRASRAVILLGYRDSMETAVHTSRVTLRRTFLSWLKR